MITTLGFRLLLFVTLFIVGLKAVPADAISARAAASYGDYREVFVR